MNQRYMTPEQLELGKLYRMNLDSGHALSRDLFLKAIDPQTKVINETYIDVDAYHFKHWGTLTLEKISAVSLVYLGEQRTIRLFYEGGYGSRRIPILYLKFLWGKHTIFVCSNAIPEMFLQQITGL